MSPAAPVVLPVTGSAFRPVQQTAYMITGDGGRQTGGGGGGGGGGRGGQGGGGGVHGGGSSTDSCVKPDASSTSSNNDTTTNNEHSVGLYSHLLRRIITRDSRNSSQAIAILSVRHTGGSGKNGAS